MATIADYAVTLLKEKNSQFGSYNDECWSLWYGMPHDCLEIALESGVYQNAKTTNGKQEKMLIKKVLKAIARDSRFKDLNDGISRTRYFILKPEFRGDGNILHQKKFCEICKKESIICGKCGNCTLCNKENGILFDGSGCNLCNDARILNSSQLLHL